MKFIFVLMIAVLSGCSSIQVQDYDAEKMEAEQIKGIKNAQRKDPFISEKTPDYVKLIDQDGIQIEVHRDVYLLGHDNIKLETWKANAVNNNPTAKCVTVDWKLQDFEFESNLPSEFLVKKYSSIFIGKMRQTIWAFDGAFIALPPSGYVSGINVRDPDVNPKTGAESCEPDESNIDTI